jgi:hypothetical protein
VPVLFVGPSERHGSKPVLSIKPNLDFAQGLLTAPEAEGLDRSAPVIPMCRSGGSCGASSAATLEGLGLEKVCIVVDGFEGSTASDNPNGPFRIVVGGWNSGLSSRYALTPETIHLRPLDRAITVARGSPAAPPAPRDLLHQLENRSSGQVIKDARRGDVAARRSRGRVPDREA